MESTTTAERLMPSQIRLAPSICYSSPTKDGCIVLDIDKGRILSLNDIAAVLFEKIAINESGITHAKLIDQCKEIFSDLNSSDIELTVDTFIQELDGKGILEFKPLDQRKIRESLNRIFIRFTTTSIRLMCLALLKIKAHTWASLLLLMMLDSTLKMISFKSMYTVVKNWPIRKRSTLSDLSIAINAVERACIWYPRQALCMQRSSTATCLLRCLGIPAVMMIGIRKMPFYGHAWVEVDSIVVNDHKNVQTFFQVLTHC